jgi:hypothetical protein
MDIDHHSSRPISIICHFPDPPSFSLPITFKGSFTAFVLLYYLYNHFFTCGNIKGAFAAFDTDSALMGARNFETGFPVSAGGPA